jgi:aspartyl protease family protein
MGVTLLQLSDGQAQVQRGGSTATLRLGGAPARLTGTPVASSAAQEIVLPVGLGGHFTSAGSINGRTVQFMVDTGATLVALSQGEAERIGLDWRSAPRAMTQTANGAVPVHRVSLSAVRVGEVEVANVDAIVMPAQMPYVLLGNSFLSRFQMRRDNDVLRLERRR